MDINKIVNLFEESEKHYKKYIELKSQFNEEIKKLKFGESGKIYEEIAKLKESK